MADIDDKIKKFEKELSELKRAKDLFLDIEIERDRWSTERLSSESVNEKADRVYFHHSCGCCADSPLLARPYIKVDGINIYSKPASFYIGHLNEYGYGEIESEGWEDRMRESNISEEAIRKTRQYLDENQPGDSWDDD